MKLNELYTLKEVEEEKIVGIEIEMEGENLFYERDVLYWNVKDDGSLRGREALEYVIKTPLKRQLINKRINGLYNKFVEYGSKIKPSDRCGVHIHLNCQHMEIYQIYNLITLYLIFENLLTHWCGDSREGNLFCLRAQDAEWLIYSLVQDKEKGNFKNTSKEAMFKYASINIAALKKFGSLEFRALQTPTNPHIIIKWINMLLLLKEKSLTVKDSRELIELCSFRGCKGFTKYIFEKYFKDLNCEGLENMVIDGLRRVQILAFTPLKNKRIRIYKY